MMNLKNEKGVTLLVLTITIIVLLIITSITIYNAKRQLAIKHVNNLYSDIEAISSKVSEYYLKNNSLPIFENNAYISNSTLLELLLKANGGTGNLINPNDEGVYYVINLSRLENLTLNYGRDYKNWSDDSTPQDYQDLYIINGVTHQIYYPLGIKLNETVYFTRDIDTEIVTKIETSSISNEGLELTLNQVNKTRVTGETRVIIDANITLSINSNFKKDTLEYGWKVANDTSEVTYTKFSLDETNTATLMSRLLDDSTEYYLYINVLDSNGSKHLIKQIVTIN